MATVSMTPSPTSVASLGSSSSPAMCRDSFGLKPVALFQMWSCTLCYSFLFPEDVSLVFSPLEGGLESINISMIPPVHPIGTIFRPTLENQTSMDQVCQTLDEFQCQRWTSCCRDAVECCKTMLSTPPSKSQGPGKAPMCPRTWDGYGCFEDAVAGSKNTIACPNFVANGGSSGRAAKDCTENGTWYRSHTGNEWTDYSPCIVMENYMALYYVGVACNVISILLLLPSIAIFLCYRQLRQQQRIQLHVCLFSSFLLTAVAMLLWEVLVYRDRMVSKPEDSLMHRNTGGCKFLYVITRFSWSANYTWMFLEGLHLYRLIVHAFKVPRSLALYHVLGWGGAFIPVLIYAIIRAFLYDASCWVYNAGAFEWIIYIPNLLCIVVNVFFLASILRILLTQLQSHPNEPSNYRRALKATFVLMPLFGLQLFLVIYRPPATWSGSHGYEIFSKAVSSSQGAVVAIIFCFLNGEVITHLSALMPARCRRGRGYRAAGLGSHSMSTQYTLETSKAPCSRARVDPSDDRSSYIPLSTMAQEGPASHGLMNGRN